MRWRQDIEVGKGHSTPSHQHREAFSIYSWTSHFPKPQTLKCQVRIKTAHKPRACQGDSEVTSWEKKLFCNAGHRIHQDPALSAAKHEETRIWLQLLGGSWLTGECCSPLLSPLQCAAPASKRSWHPCRHTGFQSLLLFGRWDIIGFGLYICSASRLHEKR